METIGIICEYNPFHNGHVYHINKIKEMYPDSIIILCVNGYFGERGDVSILSKEDKTKLALNNGVNIVVELPFVFASNSADTFAEASVKILNYLKVDKIIFGSESNDINKLTLIAKKQLEEDFSLKIKEEIKKGINYPTALNKGIGINLNSPNDLLGVSYIKAIIKNNFNIEPITIKRTSDYLDTISEDNIVSASNIREKIKNNIDVKKYINYVPNFNKINEDLLFKLIKYKIITDKDLSRYLTVDEGIEYKLIKEINNCKTLDELISKVKSKRYTYNRIRRMLIHILIGLTKVDRNICDILYIKVLGFDNIGQHYLKNIKSDILINSKIPDTFLTRKYELISSKIYDLICETNTYKFELSNKPIRMEDKDARRNTKL